MPAKKKPTAKKPTTRTRTAKAAPKQSAVTANATSAKAAKEQRLLLLICIWLALIVVFYGLIVMKLY